MIKKKRIEPILGKVLRKIAPAIGAKILIEPEWGVVGQITFASGKRRYFRYSSLDLNSLGASEISKDKDYANYFMKRIGYPVVPKSKTFFSNRWAEAIGAKGRKIDDAYRYAEKIGLPVIVKPNSGSQGRGVALVSSKASFYRAMRAIFKMDKVALVQKPVSGKDYRLVVLDQRVISAYERIPLSVLGDGRSSISALLARKQKEFVKKGRDTVIKAQDPRIREKLRREGFSLESIPLKGEKVFLLDNANLSTGGDSVDVTQNIHPEFAALAVKLTKDMGLRLCGVDLMVSGEISQKPDKFWILEINAAPGLDHYAASGKKQERIVEELYLEVLKSMDRCCG